MSILPRTLQRPLARLSYTKRTCNTCTFRCAASFQSKHLSTSSRHAAAKRAPSTWNKQRQAEKRNLTPELARKHQDSLQEFDHALGQYRRAQITVAYHAGTFGKTAEEVDEFMQAFARLFEGTKLRVGADAPEEFRALVDVSNMTEQDLLFLAMMMLRNKFSESDRYWGKKLMDMLSAAGFPEASIRIMNNALVQAKKMPGSLRHASIAVERGRLQKIARTGTNWRAMVLEGKIAHALGDSDTAIKWWWKAVDGAVAKSESMLARRAAGEKPLVDISAVDTSDLSAPWIELIQAHFDRIMTRDKDEKHEREQCGKAIEIGLQQDDPTAFYYAAAFYKKRQPDGTHIPTSHWLYHMTKAAASGVPKAAYELGVYYAESGWRYIEDEPPEDVKPTPFDSYPAPGQEEPESFWNRFRQIFHSGTPKISKASDEMFHTAAWPSTPLERLRLALQWLDVACMHHYAPAFLYTAQIRLEKTLWAGAQAPQAALDLKPERYSYASLDVKVNAEFAGEDGSYNIPEDATDQPNPLYDEERARFYLGCVVEAHVAVLDRAEHIARGSKALGRRDIEWEDIEDDVTYQSNKSDGQRQLMAWYSNPEVFDTWQKDSLALYNEVAQICDERQWTLYDAAGRLLYKHKRG